MDATPRVDDIPEEVASQMSDLDRLQDEFDAPADPPGKERQAGLQASALFAQLFTVGFGVLATRRGSHWALQQPEASALGEAFAAVGDKYAPAFESGPEMALALTALVVIGPRLATDIQESRQTDGDSRESNTHQ